MQLASRQRQRQEHNSKKTAEEHPKHLKKETQHTEAIYIKLADDTYTAITATWEIQFEIGDKPYKAEFMVIREGSETILGTEFLQKVDAHYHFRSKTITIEGVEHQLRQAPTKTDLVNTDKPTTIGPRQGQDFFRDMFPPKVSKNKCFPYLRVF